MVKYWEDIKEKPFEHAPEKLAALDERVNKEKMKDQIANAVIEGMQLASWQRDNRHVEFLANIDNTLCQVCGTMLARYTVLDFNKNGVKRKRVMCPACLQQGN